MAMVKCPECGQDISNLAVTCPHCGYPVKKMNDEKEEYVLTVGAPTYSRNMQVILIFLSFAVCVYGLIVSIKAGSVTNSFSYSAFLLEFVPFLFFGIFTFCFSLLVDYVRDIFDYVVGIRIDKKKNEKK